MDSLNPDATVFNELRKQAIEGSEEQLRVLPLAMVNESQELPLSDGINPAWAGAMKAFREQVVLPLLKPTKAKSDRLSAEQWVQIKHQLAPFQAWQTKRPASSLHQL